MTSPSQFDGQDVELIFLTFWDKAIIVGSVGGFLMLIAVCMLCILCPEYIFQGLCCYGENEKKGQKTGSQRSSSSKQSKGRYGSTESDFMYGSPNLKKSRKTFWKSVSMIKEHNHSSQSDWFSDSGNGQEVIELGKVKKICNDLVDGDTPDGPLSPVVGGKIHFTLSYIISKGTLLVKDIAVQDIQLLEGHELVSPYVRIRIYRSPKQFFNFSEHSEKTYDVNNLEHEMKTKMQRPNGSLVYKDAFEIKVDIETFKNISMRLSLCDMDKLSRHLSLWETSVLLKKTNLLTMSEIEFNKELKQPLEDELGEIRVGLSYLPTSEKLYLSIESLKNLPIMDKVQGSTDSCVKVYLMHDGKQLKRFKTSVRIHDLNPVFAECFSFDIPLAEISHVILTLVVCHYAVEEKKNKVIGRIDVGEESLNLTSNEHWNSMLQNPRKKILTSYKIRN